MDGLFKDKNKCECAEILNRNINEIRAKYVPLKGTKSDKTFIPKAKKNYLEDYKYWREVGRKLLVMNRKHKLEKKIV